MAWRGCLVKWTQTELSSSCSAVRGSRRSLRPQQSRGFRRDARRGETKKGTVAEETAPPPTGAAPPPPSPAPPPLPPRPSLLRPLMFTVGFTGCSFGAAAILQYEALRRQVQTAREETHADATAQDMAYWHRWWARLPSLHKQLILLASALDHTWTSLTDGQRTATGIIAVNTLVLCCWRIPSLQRTMIKYFTANPASKTRCVPMVLSVFSHYSVLHMAVNMAVLWSFSSSIVSLLGPEQFLAVYLSAGVISSMASYVCKTATLRLHPSLGASGAIMAVLAAVCVKVPEAKLAILLLPMFSFSAGTALKAIVAMDTAGLVLGWRLFDHAAHLGGVLFGVWYVAYGHKLIWRRREPLVTFWHSLRTQERGRGGGGAV